MSAMTFRAFAVPCTTASFSVAPRSQSQFGTFPASSGGTGPSWSGSVISTYRVSSKPRTGVMSARSKRSSTRRGVTSSMTVRSAASITPPVAPKMTPEPDAVPNGSSKSRSGRSGRWMPYSRIIRPSSRVVSEMSTSRWPESAISGRVVSNFLAVHGIRETDTTSAGSIPFRSAYQVLMSAPNICCGLLQLDRFGRYSGYWCSMNLIQPGEHDVNCGTGRLWSPSTRFS